MGSVVFRSLGMAMLSTALLAQTAPKEGLSGRVLDADGNPLEGALVIASGAGYNGWAYDETDSDGAFKTPEAGAFISARLRGYAPALLPVRKMQDPIEFRLQPAGDSVWRVPRCERVSGSDERFGQGLMLQASARKIRGPESGEHGIIRWTVKFKKHRLALVSGFNWSAGMPYEGFLTDSTSLEHRGWASDDAMGLDVRGLHADGGHWRWVGPEIGVSVSYESASPEAAEYFDKIIDTMCHGYPTPPSVDASPK